MPPKIFADVMGWGAYLPNNNDEITTDHGSFSYRLQYCGVILTLEFDFACIETMTERFNGHK